MHMKYKKELLGGAFAISMLLNSSSVFASDLGKNSYKSEQIKNQIHMRSSKQGEDKESFVKKNRNTKDSK